MDLVAGASSPAHKAVRERGGDCFLPVDIILDDFWDLRDDNCSNFLNSLIDHDLVGALLAAPLCGDYSMLKLRQPGPMPLRTPAQLDGVDNLSSEKQLQLQESALLHDRARHLCEHVASRGGLAILENPVGSMTFMEEPTQETLQMWLPWLAQVAACSVGEDWAKRWLLAASHPSIVQIASQCEHDRNAHVSLHGARDLVSGQFLSRLTARYPRELASQLADVILPWISKHGLLVDRCAWQTCLPPTLTWPPSPVSVPDGAGLFSSACWREPQHKDVFHDVRQRLFQFLWKTRLVVTVAGAVRQGTEECPLSDSHQAQLLHIVCSWVANRGGPSSVQELKAVREGQPFRLSLLQALLDMLGDSDAPFMQELQVGVRAGLRFKLEIGSGPS